MNALTAKNAFTQKCSNLGVFGELIAIENGSGDWYCTNYKADCGLRSRAVLNGSNVVMVANYGFIMNSRSYQRIIMKMC